MVTTTHRLEHVVLRVVLPQASVALGVIGGDAAPRVQQVHLLLQVASQQAQRHPATGISRQLQ